MKEKNNQYQRSQRGRKPKEDPSQFRYTVNLSSAENDYFQLMLSKAGDIKISEFIRHALFNKEIKVVTIDKVSKDYYIRLTNFYHQFQAIGNNYNQTVRAIQKNFGEKRAYHMLSKLEQETLELVKVAKEIENLTKQFKEKWL
ncbi:MAG: MobA protein [Tannerellaceae bacterium]|nr:MobA protein [Tannerellaceae bacterium]